MKKLFMIASDALQWYQMSVPMGTKGFESAVHSQSSALRLYLGNAYVDTLCMENAVKDESPTASYAMIWIF